MICNALPITISAAAAGSKFDGHLNDCIADDVPIVVLDGDALLRGEVAQRRTPAPASVSLSVRRRI